ncbi:DnaJ-domain-containing protein [Microthyrium microscopicum]|uniref:DnaJ-domain-containing protein n=1 Tax=Microthyrium microscopicum TaxID=703497 RepID=A0A6A6TZI8_9PEZI|nr:DnaJ-domain-containing protein [Microthyrium microscopicum]
MGAGQSSSGPGGDAPEIKTSYYVLLGIDREATEDEIKKAYRRKALELHPDRNYGREDEATKLFSDIQAAYEVLSDPQERSWYDSHEGAILRGFEGGEDGTGDFEYGIKITTSDDISRFVGSFALKRVDYDNVPDKFFSDLKGFFDTLASEESKAARMEGLPEHDYPSFGDKQDAYDGVVKDFYAHWNSFATTKTYFWVDRWNLTEAPDRRVRRAMEKENAKAREDAIREFNDAVRTLVAFVRKRDPRYKPNFQTDAERQKALREAAQAQAAKSRRERAKKLEEMGDAIPDWAKAKEADELEESEEEEDEVEHFECVACNKTFKSEKQWEAHEKSKKHQKALSSLKRRMEKENDLLDLQDTETGKATAMEKDTDDDPLNDNIEDEHEEDVAENMQKLDMEDNSISEKNHSDGTTQVDEDEETSNDEYAPRSKVESTFNSPSTLDTPAEASSSAPKLGKAAQKRAKRAAAKDTGAASGSGTGIDMPFVCAKCSAGFPSRTQLFSHLDELGHAAPVGKTKTKKKGKR